MLLETQRINTYYGASHILFDVSMGIDEGEVVCLMGRNGMGKSTLIKSIIGLTPPRSGKLYFEGVDIVGKRPFEIARRGVGFVPENRAIFPNLTVRENLDMGVHRKESGSWSLERIYHMFPILQERAGQMGGTLSGGEQQMLTIARALMGNPRLLLIDEPSEGLAPLIVNQIGAQVQEMKKEGMTILFSEQNTGFTLKLADRAYILEKGVISWQGSVTQLEDDPQILETYLGV